MPANTDTTLTFLYAKECFLYIETFGGGLKGVSQAYRIKNFYQCPFHNHFLILSFLIYSEIA